jgi:hypothetical protein
MSAKATWWAVAGVVLLLAAGGTWRQPWSYLALRRATADLDEAADDRADQRMVAILNQYPALLSHRVPSIMVHDGVTFMITDVPLAEYAVICNRCELLSYLLSVGAPLDQQDSVGSTALIHAAAKPSTWYAQELLKHGASRTCRDNKGRTALDWAVYFDKEETIAVLSGGDTP